MFDGLLQLTLLPSPSFSTYNTHSNTHSHTSGDGSGGSNVNNILQYKVIRTSGKLLNLDEKKLAEMIRITRHNSDPSTKNSINSNNTTDIVINEFYTPQALYNIYGNCQLLTQPYQASVKSSAYSTIQCGIASVKGHNSDLFSVAPSENMTRSYWDSMMYNKAIDSTPLYATATTTASTTTAADIHTGRSGLGQVNSTTLPTAAAVQYSYSILTLKRPQYVYKGFSSSVGFNIDTTTISALPHTASTTTSNTTVYDKLLTPVSTGVMTSEGEESNGYKGRKIGQISMFYTCTPVDEGSLNTVLISGGEGDYTCIEGAVQVNATFYGKSSFVSMCLLIIYACTFTSL